MAVHKRLFVAAASAATFLAVGTTAIASAEAALFKFSFESDEVNGYIIYDDSAEGFSQTPGETAAYIGAAEYRIDLGDKGVIEGKNGTPIIYLVRTTAENPSLPVSPENESDVLLLEVRGEDREPESEYTLLADFYFPKGSFGDSTALPTSVPSSATAEIYPNVLFPDRGEAAYIGIVQTRIEKVPEPLSVSALLGVGACFLIRSRRQRQSAQVE